MPTGRNTFLRCRRCERTLAHTSEPLIGSGFRVWWRVNPRAFEVTPTGRTKVARKYGRRINVTLREYRCAAGHLFWSGHGRRGER